MQNLICIFDSEYGRIEIGNNFNAMHNINQNKFHLPDLILNNVQFKTSDQNNYPIQFTVKFPMRFNTLSITNVLVNGLVTSLPIFITLYVYQPFFIDNKFNVRKQIAILDNLTFVNIRQMDNFLLNFS